MDDRLIDLRVHWLWQYAPEATVFDPGCYPGIEARRGELEGYLQTTSAAVLACGRSADDWALRPDPWAALVDLLVRVEAEFPGRLLIGPDDFGRWMDDPEGLTWALLGVGGFDALVRSHADLDRIPGLFARGVRLFRPVDGPSSLLGGSTATGDGRGLTELGRAFLDIIATLGPRPGDPGPTPMLDLAGLGPNALDEALDWLEVDASRARRLLPVVSLAAPGLEAPDRSGAISPAALRRLRSLGATIGVGPSCYPSTAALRAAIEATAAIPHLGRDGCEGLAISTDYLANNRPLPDLAQAEKLVDWIRSNLAATAAEALIAGNARLLLARSVAEAAVP